jgi:aspartate/glutamate racemase
VTLSSGGASVDGKVNARLTRIQWSGGAAWTRESSERRRSFEAEASQPHMLSSRTVDCVVDRINESIDIPLMSEQAERKLIFEPLMKKVNTHLRDALLAFMAEHWVDALRTLLDDAMEHREKTAKIQRIIAHNVRAPLVEALNKRIDIPMLSESMEAKLFEPIVQKLLDEVVELCVLAMERHGFV